MSTATTPLHPLHSIRSKATGDTSAKRKARVQRTPRAKHLQKRFGFFFAPFLLSFTVLVILTPPVKERRNTRHVVSCCFRVTEPKRSANFIFVQYSFYNFLQNKTCFYQTCLCVFSPPSAWHGRV